MNDSANRVLHLLGPEDPVPESGTCVFLVDRGIYPETVFPKNTGKIVPGPGVASFNQNGECCYRLTEASIASLAVLVKCAPRVLFFTSSDTHVRTFLPLRDFCQEGRFVTRYARESGAAVALLESGIEFEINRPDLSFGQVDLTLTGMDWGHEERFACVRSRLEGRPSICLQESVIDLDDPVMSRMRWSDIAFIQGPQTLRYLQRRYSFLTGNPRYDNLRPHPLPEKPVVAINCNFSWGVLTQHARPWLQSAVRAVEKCAIDYFVSRHPRDETDLKGIKNVEPSHAGIVREHLLKASVLVTRFSSLAHEALLLGRPVIYFNPHGETIRYLRDDETGLIQKANTEEELLACLRHACSTRPAWSSEEDALRGLFTSTDGRSGERCGTALALVNMRKSELLDNDARQMNALQRGREHLRYLVLGRVAASVRRVRNNSA